MRARTLIAALFGVVCAAARAAPGNLDNTFGTGGSVITNFSAEDVATSVAIQSDGKIVVAGHCVNGAAICVARYSSTGVLDTSFNSSGSAKTGVNSGTDKALALVIQGDGKIVVSGACQRPFANTLVFATEFCVVRYTMTGALDTSFNSTGIVQLPVGVNSFDRGQAVAMQADGRIVVVGACGGVLIPTVGQIPDDMCIARFTMTGTLDTSFNGTGKVVTAVSPAYDGAYSILIQPDGKIVVSGACANSNGTVDEFCMLRYTANGALDATFNATGILSFPMGSGTASANSVALQADGKYVLAGRCSNGTNLDFCMVRVTAAGALDCSFNATGKVATAMGSLNDVAYNVALEPDGKIVLAGNCQVLVEYFPCGKLRAIERGKAARTSGAACRNVDGQAHLPKGRPSHDHHLTRRHRRAGTRHATPAGGGRPARGVPHA